MKEQILELRTQGKSYNEICDLLGCSKGTVAYYCSPSRKEKQLVRQQKRRKNDALQVKIDSFKNVNRLDSQPKKSDDELVGSVKKQVKDKIRDFGRPRNYNSPGEVVVEKITKGDVISKFGEDPICYLTGHPIDWNKPRTYSFDHITPISKGGQFTLSNMGLTCREANNAKDDLLVEDLLKLCVDILTHNGYNVTRNI